jgi:hypothetical protein
MSGTRMLKDGAFENLTGCVVGTQQQSIETSGSLDNNELAATVLSIMHTQHVAFHKTIFAWMQKSMNSHVSVA